MQHTKLIELRGEIDNSIIIFAHIRINLLVINKTSTQKINMAIETLSHPTNQLQLYSWGTGTHRWMFPGPLWMPKSAGA